MRSPSLQGALREAKATLGRTKRFHTEGLALCVSDFKKIVHRLIYLLSLRFLVFWIVAVAVVVVVVVVYARTARIRPTDQFTELTGLSSLPCSPGSQLMQLWHR